MVLTRRNDKEAKDCYQQILNCQFATHFNFFYNLIFDDSRRVVGARKRAAHTEGKQH